jgi:hypothetical protein
LAAWIRASADNDPEQSLFAALQLLVPTSEEIRKFWLFSSCWNIVYDPLAKPLPPCLQIHTTISTTDPLSYPSADVTVSDTTGVGWRLRRRMRSIEKRQTRNLSSLLNDARVASYLCTDGLGSEGVALEGSTISSETYLSLITAFVSNFNPALAGIRMLGVERLDKDKLRRVSRRRHVSVDLRRCQS